MEQIQFILCDPNEEICKEWKKNINKFQVNSNHKLTVFNGLLQDLHVQFDCIVSPSNQFLRLDGAFDQVISEMFCAECPEKVTKVAQMHSHEYFNGYLPPAASFVIPMHSFNETKYGCKYLLVCPTMRLPSDVRWNKEIVYNCMFSILNTLNNHNKYKKEKIKTVLITGLASGIGRVPEIIVGAQMILAYKHFLQNLHKPNKTTSWGQATSFGLDLDETIRVPVNFV